MKEDNVVPLRYFVILFNKRNKNTELESLNLLSNTCK